MDTNRSKKVKKFLGVCLISIPTIFITYWYYFSSTPPVQWFVIQTKNMKLHIAPIWIYWIPVIIGLFLLGYPYFQRWNEKTKNPPRKSKEERKKESIDKIFNRNFPDRYPQITIDSADWWVENEHSDVTQIVRQYLIEAKMTMPCEIAILRDPRPGISKLLTINYSINGRRTENTFKEHDLITLSDLK